MEDYIYVALTFNKNYTRKQVTEGKMSKTDYMPVFTKLAELSCLNDVVETEYEYGTAQGRLHAHIMLHMKRIDYLYLAEPKRLSVKGYIYAICECTNRAGWQQYMIKEKSFFT